MVQKKQKALLLQPRARSMMDFLADICVQSKERSLKLFPIENPNQWDQADFPAMTREVFAEAIGKLGTKGSHTDLRSN